MIRIIYKDCVPSDYKGSNYEERQNASSFVTVFLVQIKEYSNEVFKGRIERRNRGIIAHVRK